MPSPGRLPTKPDNWTEALLRLWGRSTLLVTLAVACLAGFGIFWLLSEPTALHVYGPLFLTAAVAFILFAYGGYVEQKDYLQTVYLAPDDLQSWWSQSRQSDGSVTTQFSIRLQATNLTDNKFILLSNPRLVRPKSKGQLVAAHILVRDPNDNLYSAKNKIPPRAVLPASLDIIVNGAIGRTGRPLKAVITINDQFGRRYKLEFKRLRYTNEQLTAGSGGKMLPIAESMR